MTEARHDSEILVENRHVGNLVGFCFVPERADSAGQANYMRKLAQPTLHAHYISRAEAFANAPDSALSVSADAKIYWQGAEIAQLKKGADIVTPDFLLNVDEQVPEEIREKITSRIEFFLKNQIATQFAPLFELRKNNAEDARTHAVISHLEEGLGIVKRAPIADEVKALDELLRAHLREYGVRFGQFTLYMPALLKPAPTALRLVLAALWHGYEYPPPAPPPPGLVTIPTALIEPTYLQHAGYWAAGERAIRIDMLERLLYLTHAADNKKGFEASIDMLSLSGLSPAQFAAIMGALGYEVREGTRAKVKSASISRDDTPASAREDDKPADAKSDPKPLEGSEKSSPLSPCEEERFYVFRWRRQRQEQKQGQRQGKKQPGKEKKKAKPKAQNRDKTATKSEIKDKDAPPPPNPFADALKGFKAK